MGTISVVDDEIFKAGFIYKFVSNQVVGEHRFVLCLLTEEDSTAHFVCCTSQEGTMNHLIRTNNYSNTTIPYISPNEQNKLTKGTFVNCNEMQQHLISELDDKITCGELQEHGYLSEGDFEQIRSALFESDDIADIIPKNMVYQVKN